MEVRVIEKKNGKRVMEYKVAKEDIDCFMIMRYHNDTQKVSSMKPEDGEYGVGDAVIPSKEGVIHSYTNWTVAVNMFKNYTNRREVWNIHQDFYYDICLVRCKIPKGTEYLEYTEIC